MLTISADVALLNQNQREALAGFILNFPQTDIYGAASPDEAFSTTDEPEVKNSPVLSFPSSSASNLDRSGLPWDERIHASSKALTADGLWRKKRGVEDAQVAQVESQLKQLMALPTPGVTLDAPGTVSMDAPPLPPPPPPPTPIAEAPPVVTDGRAAFINLITRVSAMIAAQKITKDEVHEVCKSAGVDALPLLVNRPDLIPQVAMTIEALTASR